MRIYIFSFVAEVCGEKIIKDIREKVSVCEDLQGIKQMHAMALEKEFKKPFVCVKIREVEE